MLNAEQWSGIDRLVYYVLFPALIVVELATADLGLLPVAAFGGTLLVAQFVMAGLAVVLRYVQPMSGPAYTSVLQTLVRWNTYVALGLAPDALGPGGLQLVTLAVVVMVPTANLLSIFALARHGGRVPAGWAPIVRSVVTNPLILACLLGIVLDLSGIGLPRLLHDPMAILGRATLALGLLTVGAGLHLGSLWRRPALLATTVVLALLIRPALALGLGNLAGLDAMPLAAAVLCCGVPTSTQSYILARLLGGDAQFMAALVTATTLGALITLPLFLSLT
ncbi:MAG: AEC family transporter [Geminicoccaceae bacterium]